MTLYALMDRFRKEWELVTLMVIVIVGCAYLFIFRFKTEIQLTNAQSYWQSRDQTQSGYNRILSDRSNHRFVIFFPQLKTASVDFATEFNSKIGRGIDLIMKEKDAWALVQTMNIGNIGINQLKSINIENKNWIVGIFDSNTAKAANGYYYEQKEITDRYWVSIFEYN